MTIERWPAMVPFVGGAVVHEWPAGAPHARGLVVNAVLPIHPSWA